MPLPTVILPGFFASASEYRDLEQSLTELGFPAVTVPLRKRDWVPTLGGRSVVPILRSLDRAVKQALQQYSASQINLIGHSAGGWIARIYLGEKPYCIGVAHVWYDRDVVPIQLEYDLSRMPVYQD